METNVSKDTSIEEIIEAVTEATIVFCIASTKYGMGIENELIAIEKDNIKQ